MAEESKTKDPSPPAQDDGSDLAVPGACSPKAMVLRN